MEDAEDGSARACKREVCETMKNGWMLRGREARIEAYKVCYLFLIPALQNTLCWSHSGLLSAKRV